MEAKINLDIDRSTWQDGEWNCEPDEIKFYYNSLLCLILRHTRDGHLCGYVGIPKTHIAYSRKPIIDKLLDNIQVHGGLTYSRLYCGKYEKNDNFYFIGFDCSQSDDLSPAEKDSGISSMRTYKNMDYVINETINLAIQLNNLPLDKVINKIYTDYLKKANRKMEKYLLTHKQA